MEQGEHLGHNLSQTLSMEPDCCLARASFMTRASDIRDQLYFAHPEQQLQTIQLTCCDAYGSMLWDFQSPAAKQFFKAWNIQVRQAWRVPRNTFTYLVEGYFASNFTPVRDMIYSRYAKFTQSLSASRSKEVQFMFRLMQHDPRSVTRKNIVHIKEITKTHIHNMSVSEVK